MGRSSKPLLMLVHDDVYRECRETFEVLVAQGHEVWTFSRYDNEAGHPSADPVPLIGDFDMILGPNCWRMFGPLTKYLKDAIEEGRLRRYGPTKKKQPAGV